MTIVDFEKIARDNYGALLDRAMWMTRDRDRACDLVQSTFERCLRQLPPQLPPDRIRAWLFVVLRNLFMDCVRASGFRWTALEDVENLPQTIIDDDEESLWKSFGAEDIRAVLKLLPDGLRRPYEMHFLSDLSYREIAQTLQISVMTVGTRIHRAKLQLRDALLRKQNVTSAGDESVGPKPPLYFNQSGRGARLASFPHVAPGG